jgi:hypothetical protein
MRFTLRRLLLVTTLCGIVVWMFDYSRNRLKKVGRASAAADMLWLKKTTYDYHGFVDREIYVSYHFGNNDITDEDLIEFAYAFDDSIPDQMNGWNMRAIYLYDSPVTSDGIKSFNDLAPNCKVVVSKTQQK